MCEPIIEWYNYYGIQFYDGPPPLKVGARPMSKTMETEKAIFHLLPRPMLYIKKGKETSPKKLPGADADAICRL